MSATRTIGKWAWLAALFILALQCPAAASTNRVAVAQPPRSLLLQVRSACIAGRRRVCGRVLQITPSGVVVDSGYTSLLQPPLNHTWLTRADVAPPRPAFLMEHTTPDSVAVGLLFLTNLPRRPTVHRYDYVALVAYPAGHCDYSPVPGVKKTLRRFSGSLERAVALTMQAGGR